MPRQQQRRAYICPVCLKNGAPTRIFLAPGEPGPPKCRAHNTKMLPQINRPYPRPRKAPK